MQEASLDMTKINVFAFNETNNDAASARVKASIRDTEGTNSLRYVGKLYCGNLVDATKLLLNITETEIDERLRSIGILSKSFTVEYTNSPEYSYMARNFVAVSVILLLTLTIIVLVTLFKLSSTIF